MPKEYIFTRDGNPESVPLERWGWIAIYKDGSYLKQFDEETGQFHQFKEIDLEKLDVFAMQSMANPEDASKRFEIHITDGMQPIHYYRNARLNVGSDAETFVRLYCFGYRKGNQKCLFHIYPNDAVAILGDDGRPE